MNVSLQTNRFELRLDQILRIDRPQGVRVVCVRGSLWVTQHRDMKDHFVPAGTFLTLDRRGPTLISAMQASCVRLEEPARQPGWLEQVIPAALRHLLRGLRLARQHAPIQLQTY